MTVSSRLTQSQRQSLGFRQIQAIGLLRLSNEELTADLARRAVSNPFLRLRLPGGASTPALAEETAASESGLYAHVMAQLRLVGAARRDEPLATAFVEALDHNGWLEQSLADIAGKAGRSLQAASAMLQALQQDIEPTGLFARDLPDCLRLQAVERGEYSPEMARILLHLSDLARGGAAAVSAATGLPSEAVTLCLARIRRMDPRPGLAFGGGAAPLRAPDVIVSRGPEGWLVALNRSTLPVLDLLPAANAAPGMRAVRAEAEWLASMVERRNHTVLAVARAVLTRQSGFLDHGPGALKILSRTDIAAGLGLHGSTVGRVARDLLVETPHGLRSLCSLFGSGPGREAPGGTATAPAPAASAIRHRLARIVAAEDPHAPLGDAALAAALAAEGIAIARRTVAKYREELGIPIHSLRRTGKD